jgi:nucleotide-binding universal stress UspA family protein
MKKLHRVLVGTDFTLGAVRAARRALRLPLAPTATVELIHAAPRIGPRAFEAGVKQAALTALDRQVASLVRRVGPSGPRIRKALASGSPAGALAREARARRIELVVVGPHGHPGLPDLDLGSTAERLLAECSASVLIVRRPPLRPYRHALVAIDMAGSAKQALADAMRLLGTPARITLLHAIELPLESGIRLAGVSAMELARLRERNREYAEQVLEGEMRRVERAGFTADGVIANEDPRIAVLAAARRLRADLVALGTRRARDRAGLLLGSVARWVARRGTCDVLVARARTLFSP